MPRVENEEKYVKRCLELAEKSVSSGDLPFGALILYQDKVLAESENTGLKSIDGHAEVNVIKKAIELTAREAAPNWTIYTNLEPCPMCSFLIRDLGIKKVVYASNSPFWGGKSRWNILTDTSLKPEFTSNREAGPPVVIEGVLKKESDAIFDKLKWKMHKSEK